MHPDQRAAMALEEIRANPEQIFALRAKRIIPLLGEKSARGKDLCAPLHTMDNGMIIIAQGCVREVASFAGMRLPASVHVLDLGEISLIPGTVNAHCHLHLSATAGRTTFGKGFVPWLKSLIALIANNNARSDFRQFDAEMEALSRAVRSMVLGGTAMLGDVGGSRFGALSAVSSACAEAKLEVIHFCEWLGFAPPLADALIPWPSRCRKEIGYDGTLAQNCACAGHALYSTAPVILKAAKSWCKAKKRIFSFHLAESPEETELLLYGRGALYECYRDSVLPNGWSAPGLAPLDYALKLGLLDQTSLAVHGVQLCRQEIERFARSGAALCLCPRSNLNLGLGLPRVAELMQSGALLCLGTDGLSSNKDLDLREEALCLRRNLDIPSQALIRMLTINGRHALGMAWLSQGLAPGQRLSMAVLPEELQL